MSPELERAYRELLDQAEAHFAAEVRWSADGRLRISADSETPTPRGLLTFAERWLIDLRELRERELAESAAPRVKVAG